MAAHGCGNPMAARRRCPGRPDGAGRRAGCSRHRAARRVDAAAATEVSSYPDERMTEPTSLFARLGALSDPIRCRLLLVLDRHELTVSELTSVLQLPQST